MSDAPHPSSPSSQAPGKPHVHILVLGGTITMQRKADGGIVPSLDGRALVDAFPGLDESATIGVSTPFLVPGASLTLSQLRGVAETIDTILRDGADGVVVVQGTDTIEETAFTLDLLHAGSEPIVVTGAMRGADHLGADGGANLSASIRVAGSPGARDLGALVVLNDEIHAAAFVRKTHTALPSAFASPGSGPLGSVADGRVRVRLTPSPGRPYRIGPAVEPAPVAIVKAMLDDDARIVAACRTLGYRAIVVEAMGAGHVPRSFVEPLREAAETMPVVLATRVGAGPVFTSTYGFPGSEIDLIARGLVPAGFLSPEKARLLLAFLVGRGADRVEIAAAFAAFS